MLIVMHRQSSDEDVNRVIRAVEDMNLRAEPIPGSLRTAIGVLGNQGYVDDSLIRTLPGVRETIHVSKPYKMASLDFHPQSTIVDVAGVRFGNGQTPVVITGPCAIESEAQMMAAAADVKASGAQMLRGGAYKPRTGPHSFQGMGLEGLKLLRQAGDEQGLPVVTEVMRIGQLDEVCKYADMLQIGARNMQNFDLLKEVGRRSHPVLLKRGMSATLEELLAAAEYILSEGNANVVLCERGIRTFEKALRNTLDLGVVPLLKEMTHLPVVVDPSHATGKRNIVGTMAKAALVAGADGVMIEAHPDPETALCDGAQSLTGSDLCTLVAEMNALIGFLKSTES